jgi:hypothetical protein
MGMNPNTNKFETLTIDQIQRRLKEKEKERDLVEAISNLKAQPADVATLQVPSSCQLLRPDGTPVPKHWSVFKVGEQVVIKNYTFKVAYIGESNILFEPVGLVVVGKDNEKHR